MDNRTRRLEPLVFIAVLVTGVVLIRLGAPPETPAAVGAGLSALYGVVRGRSERGDGGTARPATP
ncbi:hypothetical protein [Streptomyces sp. NPDC018584]|uniref:hypothetical protein n=1 Tax=unclassified Streptomyces TaxID=2593676 RepID=UPI0037B1B7D1